MRFLTSKYTDPGGRSPNEDAVDYFTKNTFSAWIAADGLGGHSQGELASAEAVRSLKEQMEVCTGLDSNFVEKAYKKMNDDVLSLNGPLTTAVCAFSDGHKLWYANNGDSRFIFIRNNNALIFVAVAIELHKGKLTAARKFKNFICFLKIASKFLKFKFQLIYIFISILINIF